MSGPTRDFDTRVEVMKLMDLKLLPLNARFMAHETYKTLVDNLRRDGQLTSVPFAARDPDDDRYLVLSGNHRVKAAIDAGIEEGFIMLTDEDLPEQRKLAIQLSHNAIVGEDDPAVLKELYDKIEDIDWRIYAGLDDKSLGLLEQVRPESLTEASLEFTQVNILFLPGESERVKEAFEQAKALIKGNEVWLARWGEYDRLLDGLEAAGKSYGVTNQATALMLLLDVFEAHVTDLEAGFLDEEGEAKHSGWVPLIAIFGNSDVPASAAMTIHRALATMKRAGDVTDKNLWQAIEYWAAEYLAGDEPETV